MEFRGYFCPPAAWGPFCFPLQMIWKEERLNSTIVHPGSLNISPWNPWIFLGPTIILRLHFGNFGWVGKLGIESHQMVNLPLKYPAKIQSSRWRMLTIFGGMKVFIPDLFQQKILEIESCTGQVWPSVSFSYVRLFFLFFFKNQWLNMSGSTMTWAIVGIQKGFLEFTPKSREDSHLEKCVICLDVPGS